MNEMIVNEIAKKLIDNDIVFSEIRDERTHKVCQEILGVFKANYNSVKGMEEIIKSFNSTDLQKNAAKENLEILGKAFFKGINLFFKKYKKDLITSVLDPETIEEFLPDEFKGLGFYVMKVQIQSTEEEKEVLLEMRDFLSEEEKKQDKQKLKDLLN